jgi:putative FmdB family regulatory protein
MPTYEYKCLECDKRFEVVQSMLDEPLQECQFCHGKVKRLIGRGAGIIFKGSGFYCTDYRKDSYHADSQKDTQADKPACSTSCPADCPAKKAKVDSAG